MPNSIEDELIDVHLTLSHYRDIIHFLDKLPFAERYNVDVMKEDYRLLVSS